MKEATKNCHLLLSKSIWQKAMAKAKKNKMTFTAVVTAALTAWVKD